MIPEDRLKELKKEIDDLSAACSMEFMQLTNRIRELEKRAGIKPPD
jgi:hypothetical protein